MGERFGIPDHAPQHAPSHAPQNPTPVSPPMNIGGGGWSPPSYAAPATGGPGYAGGGGGAAWVGPVGRPKRSLFVAVILAALLGPFGLFYVNFLSGVAAILVIPPVVRAIAFMIAYANHGGMPMVYRAAIPVLWCIAIPWAIIGVTIRNWRIDRKGA